MSRFIERLPATIQLYEEGDLEGLDLQHLGQYLAEKTRIPVQTGGGFYSRLSGERIAAAAKAFARARVRDPQKRPVFIEPHQAEWNYEKRRMESPRWRTFGILYDGILYQRVISEGICGREMDLDHCTILFTNQLFGTWGRGGRRYHARVSLYGFPSLISTTGLIEAPAKPKGFYLKRQMGVPAELLEEEYEGRFIRHGDPRLTEVLKGYAMQALFFHLTGDPFCEEKDCRLYNSHWQEEVLHSQMNGRYEFCPRHEAMLLELRDRS